LLGNEKFIIFVKRNFIMPEFYVEDLDIDPSEFVSACSKREIGELIDALAEDGYIVNPINSVPAEDKNLLDEEWDEVMGKLAGRGRLRLTNEEEEIIRKIANRL
jgi:hypothetical protein